MSQARGPNRDYTDWVYDITFYDDHITTTVTHTASIVDRWIGDILRIHYRRLHKLIVGLDIEWRPNFRRGENNPVATLQLCVGRRCLIFQLLYRDRIPQSLMSFLVDTNYTFVGAGIKKDVDKLVGDHGLRVSNIIDLGPLAAMQLEVKEYMRAGLKRLAKDVLGKVIDKPKRVSLSNWDDPHLTYAQVQYACIDAFLSFEIGRSLISGNY